MQDEQKFMQQSQAPKHIALLLLFLALVLIALWTLTIGSYPISTSIAFEVILKNIGLSTETIKDIENTIIWKIRLPRVLLTILAGCALSVAGVCYQAVFRNPIVEPYILGVSSGAACGAALAIVFPSLFFRVEIMSFFFAFLAVFLAQLVAYQRDGRSSITLVLAGIIIGAVFTSFVGILKYIAPDTALRELTFWTMGGFYNVRWHDVFINSLICIPSFLLLFLCTWRMNILSLGDEEAQSLGISPARLRLILILFATLITAVCVSSVGIISWVGLMMPHLARFIFGQDNRLVFPAAAMLGAIYLLLCDTIARTLISTEIPIGIVTSIIGSPYLLWLLRTKGKELYNG